MAEKKIATPEISICIANYNYGRYLKDLLPVLLRQTFKNFEIVITDNCSTDDSNTVVKSFKDKRIRLFKNEKNLGMVGNWNRALSKARGRVVWMLNSDDSVESDEFLEDMIGAMKKHSAQMACCASVFEYSDLGTSRRNVIFTKTRELIDFHDAFYMQFINRSGPVAGQYLFEKKPITYDENMKCIADLDIFFRYLIMFKPQIALVQKQALVARFHGGNTGVYFFDNKWRMHIDEILTVIPKNLVAAAKNKAEGRKIAHDYRCSLFLQQTLFVISRILQKRRTVGDLMYLWSKFSVTDLLGLVKWSLLVPTGYVLKRWFGIYI